MLRRIKHLAVLLLLLFAGYLTAGRLLMPLLNTQKSSVEERLSQMLGVPVTIGSLQGAWFRYNPIFELTELQVGTAPAVHRVQYAQLALDVSASLMERRPVIDSLRVENVQLILQERNPGEWALAGINSQGGSLDPLYDFFLGTSELAVNESSLLLQPLQGSAVSLNSVALALQNRFLSHELQLQLRVNEQASPSHVIVQMQGDPRGNFYANLWANTEQLDWLPLLAERLNLPWQWQAVNGKTQVWAAIDSNGVQDLKVAFEDFNVVAPHNDKVHSLDLRNASLELSARPVVGSSNQQRGWQLRTQNLSFEWQGRPWLINKLTAVSNPGDAQRWNVATTNLDLTLFHQVLSAAVALPGPALNALNVLQPQGQLTNLHITTALDGSDPEGFHLRANWQNGEVQAWQQAPSGSGLQAYLEATAKGGMAEVESRDLTIQLPRLFTDAWHYDYVNGRVRWYTTPEQVQVQSDGINVRNDTVQATVRFAVANTRDEQSRWQQDFSLQVGADSMLATEVPRYLPTLSSLRGTTAWLKQALQAGTVYDSSFLLHMVNGSAVTTPTTQTLGWYRLQQGQVQFLAQWPVLQNATAAVVQRNADVDILAQEAGLLELPLRNVVAQIRQSPSGKPVLGVHSQTPMSTEQGLQVLRETPIHNTLGNFLDDWQAQGELAVDLGLGVDLGSEPQAPLVNVQAVTNNSNLLLTGLDLQFSGIAGAFTYNSKQGLSADAINAQLFEQPVLAKISTREPATPNQVIEISGQGRAQLNSLQAWSKQPLFVRTLFDYMQGEVGYEARLLVEPAALGGGKQTRLQIDSDLVGLQSQLPLPLGKESATTSPFGLEMLFQLPNQTMSVRYRDWLAATLFLDEQGIERGQVSVGARNRDFTVRQVDNADPGVLVTGNIESFDVPAWKDIAQKLNQSGGAGRPVTDYLRLIEVEVGELVLPGLTLTDARVAVEHPQQAWLMRASNQMLAGELFLPDDNTQTWKLALEYLRFPPRKVPEPLPPGAPKPPEIDPLQDADPSKLPMVDFSTKELSFGEQNMGAFSFQFRPHGLGATISNFQMMSPDSSITDSTGTFGANLEWQYQNGAHHTDFKGLFSAGDLAKVLPAWGQNLHIVSQSATFDSELSWEGSPLFFALKRASGKVNMDIDDGRFVDFGSGGARLAGALNFDSLVRRLQLDFSDIFAKGYSFDSIDGLLQFNQGVMTMATPLTIDGPSSDLSMTGLINLPEETIAADVEVQLPLGQNLSAIAALTGAWPLAVTTYIASKMFEDFTTIVYHLDGPWAEVSGEFRPPEDAEVPAPASTAETPAVPAQITPAQ